MSELSEFFSQNQPEFLVPDHISGTEYLVEQIGSEIMTQAVLAPKGSSVKEIGVCLGRIEGGTIVGILEQGVSSYQVFDRLGRDKLTLESAENWYRRTQY